MNAEILEDYGESFDSEGWDSNEAFAEDYDSAEDIEERLRRHRQRGKAFLPGRGVRRIALRGPDGQVKNTMLPTPLATAHETNRGLASLGARLRNLETRSMARQNRDGAVMGLVTLAIGGGLSAYGVFQAGKEGGKGLTFRTWAEEPSTRAAALVSATQLATTGAKLVINGQRPSGIGLTADIFAATQLAAFAYGSLPETNVDKKINFVGVDTVDNALGNLKTYPVDTVILITQKGPDLGTAYQVVEEKVTGNRLLRSLNTADQATGGTTMRK